MDSELINKYIGIPLAINVLRLDRDEFRDFKARNVYLDMVDSTVEKLEKDFYELKRLTHSMDIKRVDALRYSVNGEVVTYTADQLKELTSKITQEAISTMQLKKFNKGWYD